MDTLVTSGYIGMLFIPIEYYMVWIVDAFVTGNLHIFGNDNSNRCICVAVILGLVTRIV